MQTILQVILDKFLQLSLKLWNSILHAVADPTEKDVNLEKNEEASLRYVPGYVIYSLKKNMKNKRSLEKAVMSFEIKRGHHEQWLFLYWLYELMGRAC